MLLPKRFYKECFFVGEDYTLVDSEARFSICAFEIYCVHVSMKYSRNNISTWLANPETRAYVHGTLMINGSGIFMGMALTSETWLGDSLEVDKAAHYFAGKLIASVIFYLVYLCIIAYGFFAGNGGSSMKRLLVWLPSLIAGVVLLAVAVAFIIAIGKEALDIGGGTVERLDVDATLDGALSMTAPVAIIMALTPFLIPLDTMMQLPKLFLSDIRMGIKALDNYIREQKAHGELERPSDVLVVEDDVVCATTVMNFCRKIALKCHHVSTVTEADRYLRNNIQNIHLVVLDNFLRVDELGNNMTGGEWLTKISPEFPLNDRTFLVVIISGHTNVLGTATSQADLVLQKPWDPCYLQEFLKNKEVIKI